ncbi:MAG TPA: DNA repair protein RecN [Bryobacteraceae bacterium]|nr:DNA repair protein RecN [Bryobacteraceae bacterium]
MLVELSVENYAVVEKARIRFHAGLNLLTGETGSGKSIVVDALGLLFGGRASGDMVRSDAARARITGIFEVPHSGPLRKLLDEAGIEIEDEELIIEREVLTGGKSRAFAGSRPVTVALLREVAPYLGDIHGQHEQQRLFSADAQLEMLDTFAGDAAATVEVAALYRDWRDCSRELEDLERSEQERLRMADLWSFQRKEIEAAELQPGEDAELENEKRVLKNVARLQESANAAYSALYDAPASAATQMRVAMKRVEELCRIDETLRGVLEALKPADIAVDEASGALRDYLDRLEADPQRLEDIETRLALIDRLKRKYGSTVEEIIAFLADVRARMGVVESAGERKTALENRRKELGSCYEAAAARLSKIRQDAARKLARGVEKELASLAMQNTIFRANVESAEWSAMGADRVEFLISPNVGEEPRPLEKVASGGELSRIALALKTCLGHPGPKSVPRTLVFDEVDAGIGGAVAESVGRRLKRLAASSQVLCVTHLAQVAGFADHHYIVEKRETKGRTVAEIEELSADARKQEIGRMLSGQKVTPEALKQAEQLIRAAGKE